MSSRSLVLVAVVALFALAGGLYFGSRTGGVAVEQTQALTNFQLTDLEGKPSSIAALKGQIVVANFWATWCAPCQEEIPGFIAIQREYAAKGVTIVGISLDPVSKTSAFAKSFEINYPVAIAGAGAMDLMRDLGNRQGGLPYTVVLDRSGRIVMRHLGLLRKETLVPTLDGLLKATS